MWNGVRCVSWSSLFLVDLRHACCLLISIKMEAKAHIEQNDADNIRIGFSF